MNDGTEGQEGIGEIEVTVTHLEMRVPPRRYPPAPATPPVALLRSREMPLHFYRYLMDRVGRRWHWVNALRLSDADLAARIHSENRDIRVLYLDGAPAGFFEISQVLPEYCELVFFGLMDHAMRRGLGHWFLGAAVEAAWFAGPSRVIVQTCTLDHPAALPLYQKIGFVPVAQAKEKVVPLSLGERAQILVRP
jgi:GNAT superfamily N-acetyltransferase